MQTPQIKIPVRLAGLQRIIGIIMALRHWLGVRPHLQESSVCSVSSSRGKCGMQTGFLHLNIARMLLLEGSFVFKNRCHWWSWTLTVFFYRGCIAVRCDRFCVAAVQRSGRCLLCFCNIWKLIFEIAGKAFKRISWWVVWNCIDFILNYSRNAHAVDGVGSVYLAGNYNLYILTHIIKIFSNLRIMRITCFLGIMFGFFIWRKT
jgi:hypothetical protein